MIPIYNSRNYKHFLASSKDGKDEISTIVEITNISQPRDALLDVKKSTIVEITNISQPNPKPALEHSSTIVEITNISQPDWGIVQELEIYNSRNYKHFLA